MPRACSMAAAATVAILLLLLTNHACEGGKKIPQPATDRLITRYFFEWKTYPAIVTLLALEYNIRVSLSWLKCRLKFLCLSRRRWYSNKDQIKKAVLCILDELKTANALLGYRTMWNLLRTKHSVFVPRRIVQMILAVFDPSRSNQRRKRCLKRRVYINKGPNYAWHLDGNDKMGPTYGFFIHGCIDGFSRKILWLHLTQTNHNPEVIVHFYVECVKNLGGCPRLIRSDYGTENCILAASQMALRHGHPDPFSGVRSFQYGKSTGNTRIESWWAILKRFRLAWWLEKLEELVDEGLYNSENMAHRHCLGYCYADLISESLAEFVTLWNGHYIRKSKGARCPGGIPDVLYRTPETAGTKDFLCDIDHTMVDFITLQYCHEGPPFYPPEFKAAADAFLQRDFHMYQSDINVQNVKYVFAYLVDVTSI